MIIDTDKINKATLVEAVSKGIFDRRAELRESAPKWDSLSAISKHHVRETIMPIVTMTLAALEAQTIVTTAVEATEADIDEALNRLLGRND